MTTEYGSAHELIKKIRIQEDMGGHDGSANGGHYGHFTVLFGIFPDGAVVVGSENPDAVHLSQTGHRLNYHKDQWSKNYSIIESMLRPGDFVALKYEHDGQQGGSGGDIKILAHKLPIGEEIPEGWVPINGSSSWVFHDREESKYYHLLRVKDGEKVSWEEVVKELGLKYIIHPFGKIWMSFSQPVAITDMPAHSFDRHSSSSQKTIEGNPEFFASKGFAILNHEYDDGYHSYSCTHEILKKDQELNNLRTTGWYPVQIFPNMIIWGTGLFLYPKDLEWNLGLHPAKGANASMRGGDPDPELERGTRIFDSSPKRFARLKEFFTDAGITNASLNPFEEYKRLANSQDPRKGKWRYNSQYPDPWKPEFPGWSIEQLGIIECRWKQPRSGAARFYGIIRRS